MVIPDCVDQAWKVSRLCHVSSLKGRDRTSTEDRRDGPGRTGPERKGRQASGVRRAGAPVLKRSGFSPKFSVFGYQEGCSWGAKFQTREFRRPAGNAIQIGKEPQFLYHVSVIPGGRLILFSVNRLSEHRVQPSGLRPRPLVPLALDEEVPRLLVLRNLPGSPPWERCPGRFGSNVCSGCATIARARPFLHSDTTQPHYSSPRSTINKAYSPPLRAPEKQRFDA